MKELIDFSGKEHLLGKFENILSNNENKKFCFEIPFRWEFAPVKCGISNWKIKFLYEQGKNSSDASLKEIDIYSTETKTSLLKATGFDDRFIVTSNIGGYCTDEKAYIQIPNSKLILDFLNSISSTLKPETKQQTTILLSDGSEIKETKSETKILFGPEITHFSAVDNDRKILYKSYTRGAVDRKRYIEYDFTKKSSFERIDKNGTAYHETLKIDIKNVRDELMNELKIQFNWEYQLLMKYYIDESIDFSTDIEERLIEIEKEAIGNISKGYFSYENDLEYIEYLLHIPFRKMPSLKDRQS
ncbi:MAG: hypothetical protein HY738_21220 [Bacteroidia bacterium]|nr:hypothetical protein [Bacteroidia bacterium]